MRLRLLPAILSLLGLSILLFIAILPTQVYGNVPYQTGLTPVSLVIVATPNPDGSIYHIVQYGQTLLMISEAYGIPISEIRKLNGIPEGVSDIYEGQRLIIRVALPPTDTPTPTPTMPLPTRTPRNTTPIMTPTPLPSQTATAISIIPRGVSINRKGVGIVLLIIGTGGLLSMGIHQFLQHKKSKS